MKTYNSISKYKEEDIGKHIFAFEKLDGSNFRAEWNRKLSKKSNFTLGFGKFGTRREAINAYNPFVKAVGIFENKYADDLNKIFLSEKQFRGIDRITVYGEFFGKSSFAGIHNWKEDHDVKIFDIFLFKKGYLPPAAFIKAFGTSLDIPTIKYNGILNSEYIESVEDGIGEGIVYKGVEDGKVFMGKIKTRYWLNKVKQLYGESKMLEY